ncbi:uncharacterized protein MELLADRAFT_112321 [Melampsora larici-populina 98AG31]|uniref:Secreted protein n=1 Tax=Melampsora larici-populina (strain 98AG31 / pathotype 3-4-7) TaxID=747676 RepID=F4S642_MELLP|nr:uncharacterized protein MELLADRAFT_112321 [Melampsora larici-populina 98AG31]EGF99869.1 hypothetical protein MELLADRAFT_112321 [Melampsora larici-populina 98AG31]
MSKTVRLNIFWQILLLINLSPQNSALENKPTPLSIFQAFAEGNIWLDNSDHERGIMGQLNTSPSQNILTDHSQNQNEANKYPLSDSVSPWTPQVYSQKEVLSHSEEGYPASLRSHDENTDNDLRKYGNTQSHAERFSQPDLLKFAVPNSSGQKDHIFQEGEKGNCNSPSTFIELYDILYSQPTLLSSPNFLADKDQIIQEGEDVHCISPSSHIELSELLYPTQEHIDTQEKLKNINTIKKENHKNQPPGFEVFQRSQINWNFPFHAPSTFQASKSKEIERVLDPIQDYSISLDDLLGPERCLENHNKDSEDIHRDTHRRLLDVDHGLSNTESRKRKKKPENILHDQVSLQSVLPGDLPQTDFSDIDTPARKLHSSAKDFQGKNLLQELNLQSETRSIPKSRVALGPNHIRIQEIPTSSCSGSLVRFPLVDISRKDFRSSTKSRDLLPVLQRIGAYFVNTSPGLCYETTQWFEKLEKDMLENNNWDQSKAKLIYQAIKISHLKVTMCFLGLIAVFANSGGDEFSLDILLKEGWNLIKLNFEKWRPLNITDLNNSHIKTVTDFDSTINFRKKKYDWSNPEFRFHHLCHLKEPRKLTLDPVHHLILEWDKQRTTSQIFVTKFAWYHSQIQKFHDTYVKQRHGGFYGRGDIRNIAFKGVKVTGRYVTEAPEPANITHWYEICKSLSSSAQFHSPVGMALCQEVHSFFVSLIDNLLECYKGSYQGDVSSDGKALWEEDKELSDIKPHKMIFERIVKAISVAEYRVSVIFIGLVRALYQKEQSEHTFQLILKSAWEFLEGIFTKWKDFQFDQKLHEFFNGKVSISENSVVDYSDPEQLFHELLTYQDPSVFCMPIHCAQSLLKSWNNHLAYLQKSDPHEFDFVIKVLPDESPLTWARLLV